MKLNRRKIARVMLVALAIASLMAFSCFAEGETPAPPVGASDLQPLLSGLKSQISVGSVVGILGAGLAAAATFAFMWWGGRKLISMVMTAFKNGKLKV